MEIISYSSGILKLLDQRKLPFETEYVLCKNYKESIGAIRNMVVRGAPAISIVGAYALAQAANSGYEPGAVGEEIIGARPTAVDLANAVHYVLGSISEEKEPDEVAKTWEEKVYQNCKALSVAGSELIKPGAKVLTHCNTGPIAVGKYGTALGAIIQAHKKGKNPFVWVDETRPRFQGALTSWELTNERIPHKVITDSTAASLMQKGEVDLIMVGADRICKNGDFANKIGTYSLAVLAKHHDIPFYVLAPTSTFDPNLKSGEDIPIEQRDPREVLEPSGHPAFNSKTSAINYAFDVTPRELVTAYVTEEGVGQNPPKA